MPLTLEDVTALTDEQITPEIEAALLPKLEARATTYLTGKGLIVKPKTEYDTEFTTELAKREKAFADSESPKFYGAMDRMLAAVGMKKPDGIGTAAFVQKLSDEGKLPFTEAQIQKLEKMLKGDALSETAQALIDQAKKDLNDYKEEQEKKDKISFGKTVKRLVDSSLKTASVPVNPNLKTDAEKAAARKGDIDTITSTFNALYEGAEDEAGVLFFKKKGTDAPLMNTATGEPMTPLEIVQKFHGIFLAPAGHQQQGGGTGGGAAGGGAKSTKEDIYKAASDQGLRMYSQAWKDFVKAEEEKLK
ncbi:hypothetical protein [Spirosoma spitsbergense]|uniref:hypothetical protein n=1 Tax=Spirosoma spitsbergense TaxID=431554 RepID=UPI000371208C|nr:hypothetical protein [Spirosoma spitsbergense]